MKTRLAIWLGVELCLASGISTASCTLRRDPARARSAWHQSPTQEAEAESDGRKALAFWHQVAFAGVLFAGVAVVTVPVTVVVPRQTARGDRLAASAGEKPIHREFGTETT